MAFVIELLLIGVGLSMDAFAVAVCKGLAMRKVNKKQAVVIGLFFGGFQALMPFIGWRSEHSLKVTLPELTIGSHSSYWHSSVAKWWSKDADWKKMKQ